MPESPTPAARAGETPQAAVDSARDLLRHTVATLAYRAGKALRDPPAGFADFRVGPTTRSPVQVLAHMGDLFDWALSMAQGRTVWRDSTPLSWEDERSRFFRTLAAFDAFLASPEPLDPPVILKLFQGPVADALTHTGQIALLRRLAGGPVRGENYARASIAIGRTGPEQAPSRVEFD